MTLQLKDATPASKRLSPAATEMELQWFRRKRLKAFGRGVLLTAGAGALWFVGSLLRDPARSRDGFYLVALGILGVVQVGIVVQAIMSVNLVRDIQARRTAMHEDQRKRIFLNALDDDVPAT